MTDDGRRVVFTTTRMTQNGVYLFTNIYLMVHDSRETHGGTPWVRAPLRFLKRESAVNE